LQFASEDRKCSFRTTRIRLSNEAYRSAIAGEESVLQLSRIVYSQFLYD